MSSPATDRDGLRALLAVAHGVVAELDTESVLQQVLTAARELTGARYAALGVLNDDRTGLERFITQGIDPAAGERIGPLPRGRGVLGELIQHPAPLRLADVGRHISSYGFPADHPPMTTFLGVPVLIDGEPWGNLYLTDKGGDREFSDQDQDLVVLLAEFAGVAIDHARRYSGSEHRRHELQETVDALDATQQIARALGGQTDVEAILELVAKRGRALVAARALVIERVEGRELVIAAAAGDLAAGFVGRRFPVAGTVAETALETQQSQRIEHDLNRTRFEQHGIGSLGVAATAGLVVPLRFRAQTHGVLVAVDRTVDGPSFTDRDRRILEAFAGSAATALATAESAASDRRRQRMAAAEAERRRWARELHDETLQNMAAMRLGLASALRSADPGNPLVAPIRASIDQLTADIAGLRSLITELRPASLDELGTEAAIEALAQRAREGGLDVDVSIDLAHEQGRVAERHTSDLETAVYRITQEALTNARKHGGARRAVVEIEERDGMIDVRVRDDGTGFDPDESTSGFGLVGMGERVELLGGRLSIDSAPGAGTTVHVQLPAQRRDTNEPPPPAAAAS